MNRQEFMNRLAAELRKLPKEEIQAAMEYYSEYFDEAGPGREAEVIRELGSPSKIATQLKADYAVRQLDDNNGRQTTKKGLSAILWVILGIFAAPIALPLAIALGAVAFAVFICILAVVFSLVVCLGAVCISGVALVVVGIIGLTGSFAGGLLLVGLGLISAGLTAILCVGVVIGAKALIRLITRQIRKSGQNRQMKMLTKEESKDE